ncbi:hypothetical protein SO3561_09970 [Streptomyces olivochromogenes]|uniref:Uncharacterized protein n=1 Tax=Streptomyces olivochromogenes TaxID=1963 RepID=A0A250VW07_STROL|nr:hypothetical protein SO3561_09970 [Streptomyces olivochromogenes]
MLPVFFTLNQGSDWSAVAPVALVRYWTLSPSPAALAVAGSAVSAAAPMATATAADAAARSRFFANLICSLRGYSVLQGGEESDSCGAGRGRTIRRQGGSSFTTNYP